ncbi:helix-turn-helix domain-containing protein [Paenibacillus radicis (ex Xue et al. 2023)]|uniref:Helix-turn-helix domain-containing protein n=1 Tax=Paenibacillus radicis (ex Xue et al. 2023) TaxID=2972489 RepID=A0ABT1YSQ6_9BACL|nr:helix-turn-helix domain-containing protein [Paenibacillus radicis (ex Xue et al. 2023)]MCR8635323.1 helix-turn-helix domain-containing protein [Paenibacillus radicis (ex Xue et al. 2023)]
MNLWLALKKLTQKGLNRIRLLRMSLFNRRSVFIKLLTSYILILLLPLIGGYILYSKVESITTENASHYNLAMLEQFKQSTDARLKEVDQLAQELMLNPKLNLLLNDSSEQPADTYKYIEFIRNFLERHKTKTSDFIYDYYLYFSGSDTVLKWGLKTDSRTFYNDYYRYKHMSYEEWKSKVLRAFHNMEYMPSEVLIQNMGSMPETRDNKPANVITYIQSLPIQDSMNISGALVILIEEAKIKEMIRQIEAVNESAVYIVNDKDQVVMATSQQFDVNPAFLKKLKGESGLKDEDFNGKDVIVSYTSSDRTDWKYISIMPKEIFLQPVYVLKSKAIGLFILCLILGAVAAYLMAYRNYVPLRHIVNAVLQGRSPVLRSKGNEYEFLQNTIEESFMKEQHLQGIISQQVPVIRANFLSRLLRGHVDFRTEPVETMNFLGIQFISDQFTVILIDVDDASGFAEELSERQWASIRFIMSNVSLEIAGEHHQAYFVDLDRNRMALLLNVGNERPEAAEDISQIAEQIKHIIETRFKMVLTLAVSNIHQGINRIGQCHSEALAALDYKMVKGLSVIIHYYELTPAESQYVYPIETEIQLMNYVKSGDFDKAEFLIDHIYETNFRSNPITPEISKCLFLDMASTLLKILNRLRISEREDLAEFINPIKRIEACSTAEEMYSCIKSMYQKVAEVLRKERTDHHQQMMESIAGIIMQNLTNPNLGLAWIADSMNMSQQYMSTFFKKMYGENMTNFIAKKRMEHAKRLMEDKSLTIAQIAQTIGYNNDIVFSRAFKKSEGIPPGKYRETQLRKLEEL